MLRVLHNNIDCELLLSILSVNLLQDSHLLIFRCYNNFIFMNNL